MRALSLREAAKRDVRSGVYFLLIIVSAVSVSVSVVVFVAVSRVGGWFWFWDRVGNGESLLVGLVSTEGAVVHRVSGWGSGCFFFRSRFRFLFFLLMTSCSSVSLMPVGL